MSPAHPLLTRLGALARRVVTGEEAAPPSSADLDARRLSTGVARGDEQAFAELYERYHQRLYRLALVLSRGDEPLAAELLQSTMITAARHMSPLNSEAHLWNWLARVARQHLSKAWRQRQREAAVVSLPDLPEYPGEMAPDRILEENLESALKCLPSEDRHLIELFYYENLTHQEIGNRIGATPKAISSRLERLRGKLRTLLKRGLSDER